MKLNDLSSKKLFEVVSASQTLRNSFDEYVWECEWDYISDKLTAMKSAIKNYEIGMYNHNFITISDYESFVYYARECEKMFGLSTECEKKLSQCEKLMGTNLFYHHAKMLSALWFKEEIQDVVKWCEDVSYAVYSGTYNSDIDDYLSCWADNVDYIYNEDDGCVYEPMKKVH
jgi:hypothetical protein